MIAEGTTTEASGIFALMAFLADKDECMNRLEQLTAAAQNAYGARSEAQRLTNEAEVVHKQLADAKAEAEKFAAQLEDMHSKLDDREQEVSAREQVVAEREEAAKKQEEENAQVNVDIAAWADKVAASEAACEEREGQLIGAEKAHAAKVEKLLSLVAN